MTEPTPDTITVVAHRSYLIAWGAWLGSFALLLMFRPPDWVVQAHVGWLVAQEMIALARKDKGLADALSPMMQAVAARATGQARWYQGFRAIVSGIALLTALECGYVVSLGWGWFPWGGAVTAATLGFLLFHWIRPEKYDR